MTYRSDREAVETTAHRAVALLMFLGAESYDDQKLKSEGTRLVHSPLAGKRFTCTSVSITLAGPYKGDGIYHVIVRMTCDQYPVQAYCKVVFAGEPLLVETDLHVGEYHVSPRNLSVRGTRLEPWALPDGFDLQPALQAASDAVLA